MELRRLPFNPRRLSPTSKRNAVRTSTFAIRFDTSSAALEAFVVGDRSLPFDHCPLSLSLASSNSMISSLINDEQLLENEAATRHLDTMTTDDARLDIKSQVKSFATSFQKKCANKNVSIDTLIQDYSLFKDTIKKRIQTNSIYRGQIRPSRA